MWVGLYVRVSPWQLSVGHSHFISYFSSSSLHIVLTCAGIDPAPFSLVSCSLSLVSCFSFLVLFPLFCLCNFSYLLITPGWVPLRTLHSSWCDQVEFSFLLNIWTLHSSWCDQSKLLPLPLWTGYEPLALQLCCFPPGLVPSPIPVASFAPPWLPEHRIGL